MNSYLKRKDFEEYMQLGDEFNFHDKDCIFLGYKPCVWQPKCSCVKGQIKYAYGWERTKIQMACFTNVKGEMRNVTVPFSVPNRTILDDDLFEI